MYLSLFLLLVIWVSTALVQVPLHERLASRFEPETHQNLVSSNWVRTLGWSLRVVCVTYAGAQWFGPS